MLSLCVPRCFHFLSISIVLCWLCCMSSVGQTCNPSADYEFGNTRSSSVGTPPDLSDIGPGTNTFVSDTVDGETRTTLRFPQSNGVMLQPTTGVIANNEYTIVVYFKLDNVSGFRRLLDFKNGTSDLGLYVQSGFLTFYPFTSGPTAPIAANTYVQVVLTRTAAGMVTGYVNGVQQFSFTDSGGAAIIDSNNALRFFKDNTSGGSTGEESAGNVARIRLYNCVLSAADIASLSTVGYSTPAPISLVSWWSGDGNALDVRSRNNATQVLGSPQFVAGRVSQGMKFDGVNDGFAVPDNSNLNFGASDSLTISGWVRADSLPGGSTIFQTVVTKEGPEAVYRILLREDGVFDFEVIDTSANDIQVFSPAVVTGAFHHIAAVLNRSASSLVFYLDGSPTPPVSITGLGSLVNSGRLFIGHRSLDTGTGATSLNGVVDELSIYNRALATSEIQAIFNAGAAGKSKPTATVAPGGLIGWWAGDGNASDISGNGNNGSLQGGAAFAVGKVGQSLLLNGSNDFVEVLDSPSLEVSSQLTLEAWIKPTDTSNFRQIISKFGSSGNFAYQIGLAPSGGLRTDLSQTGGPDYDQLTSPPNVITANAWNHVAATFNGGAAALYVNGVQVASSTMTITSINNAGNTNLNLGRDPVGGQYFGGLIDEASVYNRALTPDEITSIFNAGLAGKLKTRFFSPPPPPLPNKSESIPSGGSANVSVGDATVFFSNAFSGGKVEEIPLNLLTLKPPSLGFVSSGLTYDIATTVNYNGLTTVCFNLPSFTPAQFSTLHIFHFEDPNWTDRTNSSSSYPNLCTTGLPYLSPFAIGNFAPTAAHVSISGNVTDSAGNALPRAVVSVTNSSGETRSIVTNSFGNFRLDGIAAGETYIVTVRRKGYRFDPSVLTIKDDIANLDLVAIE